MSTQALTVEASPSLVTTTQVVYALHALGLVIGAFGAATVLGSFLFGWPSIIAVIINYVKRDAVRGTWLESHFRWQIRTFWFALLWAVLVALVSAPLALVLIGFGTWVLGMGLLGREFVEISVLGGVLGIHLVEPLLGGQHTADALLHRLAHGLVGVEQRLLWQVADLQVGHGIGLALDLLVQAGHDLQQRALARAVDAEHADLGAGEEGQGDVLQDLPLRRHDLADAVHGENILRHGYMALRERSERRPPKAGNCFAKTY